MTIIDDAQQNDKDPLCNLCGLSCVFMSAPHGLIKQVVGGGYNSTPGNGHGALDDITSYRFSMCEFCLDWLFGQFQIPPEVSSYVGGDVEPWRSATERVEQDEWRKGKEQFRQEHARRTAARLKHRHVMLLKSFDR